MDQCCVGHLPLQTENDGSEGMPHGCCGGRDGHITVLPAGRSPRTVPFGLSAQPLLGNGDDGQVFRYVLSYLGLMPLSAWSPPRPFLRRFIVQHRQTRRNSEGHCLRRTREKDLD